MNSFYRLLCLILWFPLAVSAQPDVNMTAVDSRIVEFTVSTSELSDIGFFDSNQDMLFVRGSFNEWGLFPMVQVSPGVFRASLVIEGPEGDSLLYKFYYERPDGTPRFNNGWEIIGLDNPEQNRVLVLGPVGAMQPIDAHFGVGAIIDPDSRVITFSVDVTTLVNLEYFDTAVDTSVSIAGSFNGWGTTPMQRVEPTIWATTIQVSGMEGDTIDYKFVYSRESGAVFNYGYEVIDERELTEDVYINRRLVLGPADVPMVLETVPFGVIEREGPLSVQLSQLNHYDILVTPFDIANHPLMGVDVRFTAVVSGMALNSGLAGLNAMLGVPARLHMFVVDTSATENGRSGMGMQIVEEIVDPEMYTALIEAHRGDIYSFTGRMLVFNGVQVQFDLTEIPVYVGSVLQDVDFSHHLELLEPMQTGTYILNERLPDSLHQINMQMYSVFAHQYVSLGGFFHRFSAPGAPRPAWALAGDGDMIGLGDMSLRFRNDRENQYPPHMNYRRLGMDQPFTPPNQVNGTVRGFVSYTTNREPDGTPGPNPTAVVNPWYDGKIWLDGNRFEFGWIPNDLEVEQDTVVVPDDTRIVSFTVSMASLMEVGWFDSMQDHVYLRVSFADWTPLRMNPISPNSYRVHVQVPGSAGDSILYKFYYESPTGQVYNDGWEMVSTDPFENRLLILGSPGVDVTLAEAMFGYIPIEPPSDLIPVYLYTNTRFAPGDGDGNWLYVGLGSEDNPAVNLIGMGFTLQIDTNYAVPTAYTTLGLFDDGADEDYLDLLNLDEYELHASIVRTSGTNKLPYGPVMGIRFLVKDDVSELGFGIQDIEIRDADGELVDYVLTHEWIQVPTRSTGVWPGDTNADGLVDVFDVEPIGFYFGEYGPMRDSRSIQWQMMDVSTWDVADAAHADANGDGVVNQNDLLAVGFNYGKSIPSMMAKTLDNVPGYSNPEAFTIPLPSMREGDLLSIPLLANSDDIRSIGLRVLVDMDRVSVLSATPADWFTDPAMLKLVKNEPMLNRFSAAYVRTTDMPTASGDGAIITLLLQAKADLMAGEAEIRVDRAQLGRGTDRAMPVRLQVDDGSITSIDPSDVGRPTATRLDANYPNPFNPSTMIRYQLSDAGKIRLSVFDVLGREVAVLVDVEQPAGSYDLMFDASGLSSGIYLIRLSVGAETFTRSMTLLK